jgi:hypothetical protein
MKHIFTISLCFLALSLSGFGQCISGDCEDGYGLWHSPEQVRVESWIQGLTKAKSTYRGEFKEGKFSGQGSLTTFVTSLSGESDTDYGYYEKEGSFKNGLQDGYCVTTQILGDYFGEGWQYSGEYKEGERNGIGVIKRGEGGPIPTIGESGFVGYWVNGKFIKEIAKF